MVGSPAKLPPSSAAVGTVKKEAVAASVVDNVFVVEEEEKLLPDDRAADGAAKFVEVDNRCRRVRTEGVVVRVQRRILEVLIGRTVKPIATAFVIWL